MSEIDLKLLIDDFFDPESSEIVAKDFKSYDLMKNAKNVLVNSMIFV